MYTEGSKLGKFEGCESELVGLILHGICGISGYDESCEDYCDPPNGRWYALIHGRRYSFIVTECDQGFVDYDVYDDKDQARADWALIESTVYEGEPKICPVCGGSIAFLGMLGNVSWVRCIHCGMWAWESES